MAPNLPELRLPMKGAADRSVGQGLVVTSQSSLHCTMGEAYTRGVTTSAVCAWAVSRRLNSIGEPVSLDSTAQRRGSSSCSSADASPFFQTMQLHDKSVIAEKRSLVSGPPGIA